MDKRIYASNYKQSAILTTAVFLIAASFPLLASAQAAVLGYKINAQNQVADSGFTPTLVGSGGTISLTDNPYNSGFITNGTYTSYANASAGWNSSYWLCYDQQTSCTTPTFVNGSSVSLNVTGAGQAGDHITLWWKYVQVQNLGAVLGYKLDGAGAQTSAGSPTLVGPAGTVTLTGNPYNSNFIAGGTYIAYANAPSGYTASYWLCYDKAACTTPVFVPGNSVSITVSGTGSDGDYVTLWWKYTAISTGTPTYSWHTGEWGSCVNSQQTRTVQCKSNTGTVVADSYCTGAKPVTTQSCTPPPIIPTGITSNNVTSQWSRGTILLQNFTNMYNGHIIRDDSDAAYPYKMWFFGWANGICNPGRQDHHGCDAIFYARSANGLQWGVYSDGGTFDTTMTPSQWKPVITAQNTYYDEYHDGDPSVVKVGSTYYMVYTTGGFDLDRIMAGQPGDTDGDFGGIMGAVSSDGIHWERPTRPFFASPGEAGGRDTAPGNMYARPSLLYENGKFRMWFDYWVSDEKGLSMGYAELPMANPTASSFLTANFTPVNVGNSPQVYGFPNPDVIKAGNTYYAYADPYQTLPGETTHEWRSRRLTEATSPDGIHWTATGFVEAESGCDADHVPEAFYENGTIYITYGCQKGGNPYDYQYYQIRRMQRMLSGSTLPATGSAVIGLRVGADNQTASAPVATPTLVGPGGTISLTGNPFNSGFVTNGTYTSYANAPSGYTASYWLCYGTGTICTTPNFVTGNSASINVTGTQQPSDVVTLWWKYTAISTTDALYCPHITRDLRYGDTDAKTQGQVTELQKFLASYYEDYPEWGITGNFRSTTKQFVIRFQREYSIVPALGYVGSITRAKIAEVCHVANAPTNTQTANALSALESALKAILELLK